MRKKQERVSYGNIRLTRQNKVAQCLPDGIVFRIYDNTVIAASAVDGKITKIEAAAEEGTLYLGFLWKYV